MTTWQVASWLLRPEGITSGGTPIACGLAMVVAPKNVSPPAHELSTAELLGRLTQQTVALGKAEVARVKSDALALAGPAGRLAVLSIVALVAFSIGLAAFCFALYFGVESLTNSPLIASLVAGGAAWLVAFVMGGLALGGLRAIIASSSGRSA